MKIDPSNDSPWGFTPDRFDGYLWDCGERILISFIESKDPGKGHLSELFLRIEQSGKRVAVPTPLGQMESILKHKGFLPHVENDPVCGPVEVWEREGA